MIDYAEFGKRAATTAMRCVALVRHGERPHIDPDDPTFGAQLPLSVAGEAMARACGEALAHYGPSLNEWKFLASPLRRTRITAETVAKAMGTAGATVVDCPEAGIPGLWMLDEAYAFEHYKADGPRPFTDRFMRDGVVEGYRPIADTAKLALEWIGRGFGARCAFIATHDVFAAALLRALAGQPVTCARWVGFLQGCAFFEREDGSWECQYLVPDKTDWHNEFVS